MVRTGRELQEMGKDRGALGIGWLNAYAQLGYKRLKEKSYCFSIGLEAC